MHLPPDELRALTLEEFEALQVVLDLNPDGQWMNVEMIDGYFAALICAPTLASTGLRFGPVFGVEIFAEAALPAPVDVSAIEALLRRHWHTLAATLAAAVGDPTLDYQPLLYESGEGVIAANDWARGFLCGVADDPAVWKDFEHAHPEALAPVCLLAAEAMPGQGARLDADARAAQTAGLVALLALAYRHFEPLRA